MNARSVLPSRQIASAGGDLRAQEVPEFGDDRGHGIEGLRPIRGDEFRQRQQASLSPGDAGSRGSTSRSRNTSSCSSRCDPAGPRSPRGSLRDAQRHAPRRHHEVEQDDRTGPDDRAVADRRPVEHDRSGRDQHLVADRGPSMCALCPTVQRAPIIVASMTVQCTTVPSWILVFSPTLMVP